MLRFIRKFGTFKRPPPGYMFKRPVVPSDLQPPKKDNFDVENEKWCDDDEKNKNNDSQDDVYNDRQD